MLGLGFADQKLLPISTTKIDALDHESLISQLSKDLVSDLQRTASSGPDQHLIRASVFRNIPKEEASIEAEEESDGDDEKIETPQKNSLKECRVSRPEALPRKQEPTRPASVDLNNRAYWASSSPRLAAMKKTSAASRETGALPSPSTPSYSQGIGDGMGLQKAGNLERVPLQVNCSRRNGNAALLPFNNGRSLPSKWEDAEKWIFSPVTGSDSVGRPPLIPPQQRRPLSKSGPLGGLGIANNSSLVYDGGKVGNFTGRSPFSAGVLVPDSLSGQVFGGGGEGGGGGGGGGGGDFLLLAERSIMRSGSENGWSDTLIQCSLPKDEKDCTKDASTMFSTALSRRDMGTQMSPVHRTSSSLKERHSCSASGSSVLPIAELQSNHPSKLVVKDVQVDDHVTVAKRSKKHGAQGFGQCSTSNTESRKKVVEAQASDWEMAEADKCVSKVRRDEANIMAWENLQKAKAEAEIRKLEVKLEKIRTSSMNKIMNRLRLAQRKAQEMRSSVSDSQVNEVTTTAKKTALFCKVGHMGSLTGCFNCHSS